MKTKPSPFRAWALAITAVLLAIPLIATPADAAGGHRSHGGHHSSGHHHGGSHHGGHYGGGMHSGHFLFHFHSYGYYPYYSHPYYSPYSYPYGRPYYRGYGGAGVEAVGALDLDIRPGRTTVYEDGRYLGTVDDFDGFPSYLWLSAGTHELTFYLEGYRTLMRQYSIAPGRIARVEDFLEQGDSVSPEDLLPGDGRRRGPASRQRELGRLHLEVTPRDATVYMDGRFVGTGEELAATDLTVEPGDHVLEVVRPGYQPQTRRFTMTSSGTDEQAIDLERP